MNTRRPTFADLRLVCDYLRGLRNEIAVDLQAIELARLDPARYGKFPRPSRWISKAKRFALLSRILHRMSLPIWYFIGPLLFIRQCNSVRASCPHAVPVKFDDSGQVLALSIRALDIVHPRHIDTAPRQWIELPWLPLSDLPTGAEALSVMALLTDKDIERSLTLANLAHRALQRRRGMSEWGLQSYTALRWFLVRLGVDKLPGPLLMVEHFDRWAVLVDGSVRQSRSHKPKRHLTVMQHGSVNADKTPRGIGLRLPTRLHGVNHLRAYSPADVEVFKAEILSPRCGTSGLDVSFYSPSVTLTDLTTTVRSPSVLFVGYPLCETAHCALLAALRQKGSWQIFYKPHPANPASAHIGALPWTLVEGRSVFPRVDLLISYPSTMVSEYATHDIPAVVHPMDVSAEQLLDRLPEIFQIIQLRHSTIGQPSSHKPTGSFFNLP